MGTGRESFQLGSSVFLPRRCVKVFKSAKQWLPWRASSGSGLRSVTASVSSQLSFLPSKTRFMGWIERHVLRLWLYGNLLRCLIQLKHRGNATEQLLLKCLQAQLQPC